MDYIEITVAVRTGDAERASDVLRAFTGGDVWIETPFVQPDLESDAIPETGGTSLIHGYRTVAGADLAAEARRAFADAELAAEIAQRVVAEEDWAESWKEFFHVERFGQRIVVVPTWREHTPGPGDVVISLDPGMAFGTGQHETTRMCLEALERTVRPGASALDVGCGSGILSVAAAKLGAAEVVALDIDENCVRISRENARINGVEQIVRASTGGMGADWPIAESSDGRFDVIVANIIARVIIDLAGDLTAALTADGRLIVSGIIALRESEVVEALEAAGARIDSVRAMGEWRCIEAVRR